MLTLIELKEALAQLDAVEQSHMSERGRCSACRARASVGDDSGEDIDFDRWHVSKHETGCRYVRVHDALQRAIEKGESVLTRHGDAMLVWRMEYDPVALLKRSNQAKIEREKIVEWLMGDGENASGAERFSDEHAAPAEPYNLGSWIARGEHWR